MTASATGTFARLCDLEQALQRGRIAAGVVVAAPEIGAPARCAPGVELVVETLPGAHDTLRARARANSRSRRPSRARSAMRSATIDALRAAPSLSKFHVPQRSRVPAASTAAARISGVYVRSSTTIARSNSREAHAARALLGFAVAGEGNDHGPRAAGDDVEHRVVPALRHRDERPPQERREIDARAFDDRASGPASRSQAARCPASGMFGPASTRHVRWPNRDFGCAASASARSSMPTPPPPAETTTSSRPPPSPIASRSPGVSTKPV